MFGSGSGLQTLKLSSPLALASSPETGYRTVSEAEEEPQAHFNQPVIGNGQNVWINVAIFSRRRHHHTTLDTGNHGRDNSHINR